MIQDTQRITLTPSPYTYVRTIVMGSELFEAQQYARLLKMSIPSIIQFLEESTYKQEIDELAVSESGIQLIEHSIQRNFRRAAEKLRRISDETLRLLIDAYLWRNDIQNIKTLLRAKHSNQPASRVVNLIIPGSVTKLQLMEWYNAATPEAFLEALETPLTADALKIYQSKGMSGFEATLTKRYYEATLAISQRLTNGHILKDFLLAEIEAVNIMTILKLKAEEAKTERIEEYIVYTHEQRRILGPLLAAKSIQECMGYLEKTKYAKATERGRESFLKTKSLLELERDIQSYVLSRTRLLKHQHPLSVDVVLSYLFAKTNEIRNLFIIIKGKQLGVEEEFLSQEIII